MKLAIILGCTMLAAPARADPNDDKAKALFFEGKSKLALKDYPAACAAFQASHELVVNPSALRALADCRESNAQLASAYLAWDELEHVTAASTDPSYVNWHAEAQKGLARVGPRRSKLTLHVPQASEIDGLEILRDGKALPRDAWDHPIFVDGATTTIAARAPGYREWTTTLTVRASSDVQDVDIPALAVTPPPEPPKPEPKPEPVKPVEPPVETPAVEAPAPARRVAPLVLGGVAVAAGATAIVLEVSARGIYDDALAGTTRDARDSAWHRANTRRYVAEGLGVAAVASAGIATYLYLRGGERGTRVTPVATATQVGLVLDRAW